MRYQIDLSNISPKEIYPLGEKFSGTAPDGTQIGFTNYYMTKNERPFFGISGEIHFSRVAEDEWEDTIIKAKMGGLNLLATYVFWNVHEEVEGVFRWDGVRNVRKFLELCKKHGLMVILRIGPFGHGEMRNGAFPDWIYGKPFEVRSCDPNFYAYVRRYFSAIHEQVKGLYYSEGGPVVAAQLDNEYMHSAAPWEMTTGISNEWVPGGDGGDQYMLDIKNIMQEVGIVTPFYTCTAWGGARTPIDEALPLWGGYSYWPWMFYDEKYVHPATPEYLYRDHHNNEIPVSYNFEPRYKPEERPYACCEMMGGMQNYYNYRFILDFNCVDAMANIKMGSGCNLLGYYMYRGGSNPTGEKTPYLNECGIPKISYDYQAAISQFGQLRPSWYKLKTLHYFCQTYAGQLCGTKTVLPDTAEYITPTNTRYLRYSVRVKGDSGFLFLNNFQDHFELPARKNETVQLNLPSGMLEINGIGLESGISAILPFNQKLASAHLRYATAQPITHAGKAWFFFAPDGMKPRYVFDAETVREVKECEAVWEQGNVIIRPELGKGFEVLTTAGERFMVITLSQQDSGKFYLINGTAFLSDVPLLWDGEELSMELEGKTASVCAYPAQHWNDYLPESDLVEQVEPITMGIFKGISMTLKAEACAQTVLTKKQVGPSRFVVEIPTDKLEGHKAVLLYADYYGDIGSAFIDGRLVNDNFANGAPWVTRVDSLKEELAQHPLTIYITPIRENAKVNVDSPMAARLEESSGNKAGLEGLTLRPVNQVKLVKL